MLAQKDRICHCRTVFGAVLQHPVYYTDACWAASSQATCLGKNLRTVQICPLSGTSLRHIQVHLHASMIPNMEWKENTLVIAPTLGPNYWNLDCFVWVFVCSFGQLVDLFFWLVFCLFVLDLCVYFQIGLTMQLWLAWTCANSEICLCLPPRGLG